MFERVKYWIKFFILYKNWYEILESRIKKGNLQKVIFNNGIVISSSPESPISVVVDEIFLLKRYIYKNLVLVKKHDIVVDIGAHIGTFTLFALINGARKVYAYEPTHKNVKYIKENCKNYKNIKVKNYAVSDTNSLINLYVDIPDGGNSIIRTNGRRIKKVKSVTLENIFKNEKLDKINFLKIDCEGAEGLIFKALPDYVLKRIDKIAMEYHDNTSPMKHNKIIKKLVRAGFSVKLNKMDKIYGYIYAWRQLN